MDLETWGKETSGNNLVKSCLVQNVLMFATKNSGSTGCAKDATAVVVSRDVTNIDIDEGRGVS